MIIVLVMMLATTMSPISSSRTSGLEKVMRDTLKQVMRCPEWASDEDIQQPVAAFSPARYMQLVALVRKDSRENSCGRSTHLPFHLNNPRSWNFCDMGICSDDSCSCFKNFVGEKCNKFQGQCWLLYCRLLGCNKEAPTLYCSCNPTLYGTHIARGLYFYDHGFESSYIPPPAGYVTNAFIDSHLIREIAPGQFEIIGGNYNYDNKETRSYFGNYGEKRYFYNLPRSVVYKPARYQNEQKDRYAYYPYSKSIQNEFSRRYPNEESQRNEIIPYNSRKLEFLDFPYSKQKTFDSFKSLKSNRDDQDFENFDSLQTFPSVLEDDSVARRTGRNERTNTRMQMKSSMYLENPDDMGLQYGASKNRYKWPVSKQKIPYFPKKYARSDLPSSNVWYKGNYRTDKEFSNNVEDKRPFYSADDYRMMRQKSLEQNTIRDTWDDDEEEADDNEDFKFSSGSQMFRPPIFQTFLCSSIIILIYCFLE